MSAVAMSRMFGRTAVVFGFVLLIGPASLGQDISRGEANRTWYLKLGSALNQNLRSQPRKALVLWEEAFSLAPDAEHKADTLFHLAKMYEGRMDRENAITAYKRILSEYPSSPHLPRVCLRLGEIYRSVGLIPGDASEERVAEVMQEQTNKNCGPFFEAAVAVGPPDSSWILTSKYCLCVIRREEGQREDAMEILHELAKLNIYDIKEPDYVGPYEEARDVCGTTAERLDETRLRAAGVRKNAERELVGCCIVPGDRILSMKNLQVLVECYPNSQIASMAQEQIHGLSKTIQDEMAREAASDIDPGEAPQK